MTNAKVYIAAESMITSVGAGVQENFDAIMEGRTGLRPAGAESGSGIDSDVRVSGNSVYVGIIDDKVFQSLAAEYGSQWTFPEVLCISCIDSVRRKSGLDFSDGRTGLVISTAKGNIVSLEGHCADGPYVPEDRDSLLLGNMAANIAGYSGIPPKNVTVISNACISGVSALVYARRMIMSGRYANVIVAGVDIQCRFITSGFASFKSLSDSPCLPYDSSRCGLNLGEACGVMVLTSDEELAGPDAVRIDGGGLSDDANHISGPSRTGDGLYFAVRDALDEAGVTASCIDGLQMHGTATAYNDEMESKAANLAGLQNVPVQSLKPFFGHTMGASGVVETIMLAEQMKRGVFFGVNGFCENGVPFPLNVSGCPRRIDLRHCVKTASGFGGTNAAIVLSRGNTGCDSVQYSPLRALHTRRRVVISSGKVEVDGKCIFEHSADFEEFIRAAYKSRGMGYTKFYKMDPFCKLSFMAAEWLLDGVGFREEQCAVLMSGKYGSLDTDMRHQHIIDSEGERYAAPAVFVYTLPNVAAAEISIRHHIKGENTWFWSDDATMSDLRLQAASVLARPRMKYCIIGHSDFINGKYLAIFELVMDELIEKLKVQLIEALNLEETSPEDIDPEAPLFGDEGLGLDSIDALEIILLLDKEYGIKLANPSEGKKVFYSVHTMADCIRASKGEA